MPYHEITLLGEDTGTIVSLSFSGGARPTVRRAVVFLSTGETLCVDPASAAAAGSPRLSATRTDARRWEIHMSGSAALAEVPVRVGHGAGPVGRSVPLGLNVAVEGVDEDPWPRAAEVSSPSRAAAVRFSGAITVGSLIYADDGLGWAASAPTGPSSIGARLLGAFQDGAGVYAAGGGIVPSETSTAVLLAGSKSTHAPVHQFLVDLTAPVPALICTVGGSAPADVVGEVRNIDQQVDHIYADLDSAGQLSASLFPFVLVRAGITGIGLVEHVAPAGSVVSHTAPEDDLPDPY